MLKALAYDPAGRLYQTSKGALTTRMQYDGSDLIAEYNAANVLQRRYVHGPGTDEPILWYEGAALTDKRYLLSDERGSVTSITNAAGTVTHINSYDEYGIPAVTKTGRFGYTGQMWLPEIGMNYYKARMYSPTLGRLMQPDPIGYGDGMNLYINR
jgi:RHS repeat-associated protein